MTVPLIQKQWVVSKDATLALLNDIGNNLFSNFIDKSGDILVKEK